MRVFRAATVRESLTPPAALRLLVSEVVERAAGGSELDPGEDAAAGRVEDDADGLAVVVVVHVDHRADEVGRRDVPPLSGGEGAGLHGSGLVGVVAEAAAGAVADALVDGVGQGAVRADFHGDQEDGDDEDAGDDERGVARRWDGAHGDEQAEEREQDARPRLRAGADLEGAAVPACR